jgi:hypothetical protein
MQGRKMYGRKHSTLFFAGLLKDLIRITIRATGARSLDQTISVNQLFERKKMKTQFSILFVFVVSVMPLTALAEEVVMDDEIVFTEETLVAAKPQDPNDRAKDIEAKFEKLHGNLDKFLDTAIVSDQVFEPNEIEFLRREKGRSKRAKDRMNNGNGMKMFGRNNDFDKKGKGNGKDRDEYDDGAFDDFEGSLEDLNTVLLRADSELKKGNKAKALSVQANSDPNGVNKCQELVDASITLGVAASVVRGLAIAAATAYDTADSVSEQTALGFNASTAATVFAVAAGALDMTATGLEIADEWTAEDLKAECLSQINIVSQGTADGVDEINQKVTDLQRELDALRDLMNVRMDMLEKILNTPQGQRPSFPEKE